MKILLATNNEGKASRFKRLLKNAHIDIEIFLPRDLGLETIDVAETGNTLEENAEIKARAYFGKVDMPILSNDTGFYVEGEGMITAPKRIALNGKNENDLSKEEIAKFLLDFWKGIATKYGGRVDAAWVEAFVCLSPDGNLQKTESRREVILTNEEFGVGHIEMPIRVLYISLATHKPVIQQTPEEELIEMRPVIDAISQVLSNV